MEASTAIGNRTDSLSTKQQLIAGLTFDMPDAAASDTEDGPPQAEVSQHPVRQRCFPLHFNLVERRCDPYAEHLPVQLCLSVRVRLFVAATMQMRFAWATWVQLFV